MEVYIGKTDLYLRLEKITKNNLYLRLEKITKNILFKNCKLNLASTLH